MRILGAVLPLACLSAVLFPVAATAEESCWPGFVASPWFNEQVRELRFDEDARAIIVAPMPEQFDDKLPTVLVLFATPNGNTVEQTLGCKLAEGLDWHYDIQHAAAQVRRWQATNKRENVVLACIQAGNRSWPTWRRQHDGGEAIIAKIMESIVDLVPSDSLRIVLTGHSGGGSFMFGFMDSEEEIPDQISRIAFLDANYGYSDDKGHAEKILRWLDADDQRQFIVLAYDDRNIMLNGKKVVGPTGGTYRASHRMIDRLEKTKPLVHDKLGEFDRFASVDGRLLTLIHPNPENIILHTRLVGEMNGLLYVLTLGTPEEEAWEGLGRPRAYSDWVQPEPFEPAEWQSKLSTAEVDV